MLMKRLRLIYIILSFVTGFAEALMVFAKRRSGNRKPARKAHRESGGAELLSMLNAEATINT
jgi:hypothetical protein